MTMGLFDAAREQVRLRKKGRYAWITNGKRLGKGGQGQVYAVFNTTNWCLCAGKRIQDADVFDTESDIFPRLQHRHVVRCIDIQKPVGLGPGLVVMEYYPLGDLRAFQYEGSKIRFTELEIIQIVAQASMALEYIHGMSVIHRDMKPENILVRSTHPVEIAVTDFGCSKMPDESEMYSFKGTQFYMAPEVAANDPRKQARPTKYTKSADIWSLGMTARADAAGRGTSESASEREKHPLEHCHLPPQIRGPT